MTDKKSEKERKEQDGQPTLEESFERLDRMIATLEDKDTSLEDSFRLYQAGMELVKKCSETVAQVERKVLVMNEDGGLDEF